MAPTTELGKTLENLMREIDTACSHRKSRGWSIYLQPLYQNAETGTVVCRVLQEKNAGDYFLRTRNASYESYWAANNDGYGKGGGRWDNEGYIFDSGVSEDEQHITVHRNHSFLPYFTNKIDVGDLVLAKYKFKPYTVQRGAEEAKGHE